MATNFVFVGALPRSGTAWLSVLLNLHPDCLCLHEGTYKYPDHISFLRASGYTHLIDVGAQCMFSPYDSFAAKRIFLKRDIEDIALSAQKFLDLDEDTTEMAIASLDELAFAWVKKHNPYIISYDELFNEDSIIKLWMHIFNGEHPDMDKLRQIIKLNIQAKPPTKEFKTLIGLS